MKFKAGDMVMVVIIPGWHNSRADMIGLIGTVRDVCLCPESNHFARVAGHIYYHIDWRKPPYPGHCVYVEQGLRLIPPPEAAEWDDCVWQPKKVAG